MRSARGAITLILLGGLAAPALAQNKKAEALNDEGKDLYSEKKDFEGAAAKFRQAIQLSPDPRYYFNLCSALDRLELYDQALEACDGVFAHKPRADLAQKTGAKAAEIRQRMKGGEPEPEPKPPEPPPVKADPGKPPPAAIKQTEVLPLPRPNDAYRPPTTVQKDSSTYGWGLGVALAGMRNNYQNSGFTRAGFGLKVFADIVVFPHQQMGIEPYLHFSSFQNDPDDTLGRQGKPLSIFDIGAAWFWHLRFGKSNFYLTPSAGLSFSFLNPRDAQGRDVSYLTAGIRFEAALSWVIANRHVLSLAPAFTIYPPGTQVTGPQLDMAQAGLSGTGSTFSVLLGYTYRFDYSWFTGLPLE